MKNKSQGTSKAGEMDWADEFDKKFRTHGYYLFSRSDEFLTANSARIIKAFIRTAIQQAIAQERERIYNTLMAKQERNKLRAELRQKLDKLK